MSLTGKVVVITGAARGMGREYVRWFLREGSKVVALDQSWEDVDDFSEELGGFEEALVVTGNITSDADLDAAYQATMDRFGTVDVLLNNASMRMRDVHPSAVLNVLDSTDEQWQYAFEASVLGSDQGHPPLRAANDRRTRAAASSTSTPAPASSAARATSPTAPSRRRCTTSPSRCPENSRSTTSPSTRSFPAAPAAPATRSRHGCRRRWAACRVRNPVGPGHTAPAAVWLAQQDSSTFTGQAVDAHDVERGERVRRLRRLGLARLGHAVP